MNFDPDWINIDGNHVHMTAKINRKFVDMGTGNVIGPYSVIGFNGEMRDTRPDSFQGRVIIGNNNRISELVTIQRPFNTGESTYIGSDNIIMAHSHIGHHAEIGDGCEISTGTIIGGYAVIRDNAQLKLGVTVRNRIEIGEGAVVGMGSVVVRSVEQGKTVYGNPAK